MDIARFEKPIFYHEKEGDVPCIPASTAARATVEIIDIAYSIAKLLH
jgi:hypothetical protein